MTSGAAPTRTGMPDWNAEGAPPVPVLAHWDATYACNFRCSFCLSSSGSPAAGECSTGEARALIDQLYEAGLIFLRVLGGEPFFRQDMIELFTYAAQKGMLLSFSTNASLITEQHAESLAQIASSLRYVQVSLYGPDEETYARVTGSPGSFERALRGLRLMVERGLAVSILVVVTPENVRRMRDYYDVAKQSGAKEFRLTAVAPLGRAACQNLTASAETELWAGLVDEARWIREGNDGGGPRLLIHARPLLGRYLKRIAGLETFYSNCIAGTAMVFVDPAGRAAPCPFLLPMPEHLREAYGPFPMQELKGRPFREVWDSGVFESFRACHDPARNARIQANCRFYREGDCAPCVLTPCDCMELVPLLRQARER